MDTKLFTWVADPIAALFALYMGWDWSTRFSFDAVIIASFTLLGVGLQIWLARRELSYVEADLVQNRRMIDEALKRPLLVLMFMDGGNVSTSDTNAVGQYLVPVEQLRIKNLGERTSHEPYIELYVPEDALERFDYAVEHSIHDQPHRVFGWPLDVKVLHPKRASCKIFGPGTRGMQLKDHHSDIVVRWRVFDDFGTYPEEGYGKLIVTHR